MLQPGEDTELTTSDAEPAGATAAGVAPTPDAWLARGCGVPEQPAHARITAKAAAMRARMTRCYARPRGPRG